MRVLDGVFTTSNVRDTILWLLVVIENVKSRLALMSLQNANTDGGGDRLFYSHIHIIIFSISRPCYNTAAHGEVVDGTRIIISLLLYNSNIPIPVYRL